MGSAHAIRIATTADHFIIFGYKAIVEYAIIYCVGLLIKLAFRYALVLVELDKEIFPLYISDHRDFIALYIYSYKSAANRRQFIYNKFNKFWV